MENQLFSKSHINAIATRALLDKKFQAALLNGHRREMLEQFPLSDKEQEVLLDLKVDNVDHFITRLDSLMVQPVYQKSERKSAFAM